MRLMAFLLACCIALTAADGRAQSRDGKSPPFTRWSDLLPEGWDPLLELRRLDKDMDDSPESMRLLREIWDKAPTNPKMEGAKVRIPGYVVPLEFTTGGLKEFLLVPYFGACIHSPPPPANQIVHVLVTKTAKLRTMETVWVSGTLRTVRADTSMGTSGYRIEAADIKPYVEERRK